MKKILVLFLSLQLLTGNELVVELTKIPALLNHFQEHQREICGLDFFTFLKMHYADPEHQRNDEQRHGSLPLKVSHVAHAEIFNMPTVLTPSVFVPILPKNIALKTVISYQNPFLDANNGISIFQPPRLS